MSQFHLFYFQNEICGPNMSQFNYFLFSEWTETSKNEPPVLNIVSIPPALPFIYLFIYLLNKYHAAMKQISFVSETKSFVYETNIMQLWNKIICLWNKYHLSSEQYQFFLNYSQHIPGFSRKVYFHFLLCSFHHWTMSKLWSMYIVQCWLNILIMSYIGAVSHMRYGIMITLWIWKDKHMWWVMHIWMCICWVCTWWVCTCWMCIWCRSTTWWVCKWIHLCKMPASRSQGPWWWKWWRRWSN